VRRPRHALWLGIVDLIGALVLFFISGAVIVAIVAGVNRLAGVPLYPLGPLFSGIRGADPWQYLWVYMMLFSTILPTMLHAGIALFSMSAWITPTLRGWIARTIGSTDAVDGTAVLIVIGTIWTASALLPFFAMWGFTG
jgi:hypothetical protein